MIERQEDLTDSRMTWEELRRQLPKECRHGECSHDVTAEPWYMCHGIVWAEKEDY